MGKNTAKEGPGPEEDDETSSPSTSGPQPKKESGASAAIRALKAMSKSTSAALRMDDVPYELLIGERVDLHRWTLLMSDKNLKTLSHYYTKVSVYLIQKKTLTLPTCSAWSAVLSQQPMLD